MHSFEDSLKKLEDYINIDSTLNATTESAFWLKDTNRRFVRYNQAMLDLLYPTASFDELYGKTDWEYAQSLQLSSSVLKDIKECCSLSDIYVLNATSKSEKFFERCNILGTTEQRWILTTKLRIPPESTKETCLGLYGTAIEFKQAEKIILSGILTLEKLSENCFRLVE